MISHIAAAAVADLGSAGLITLLAGILCGGLLRILVSRLGGTDPRRTKVWILELVAVFALANLLGISFATALDPVSIGPILGSALTTYAGASAGFGYLGGRELDPPDPWRWAIAHFITRFIVSTTGITTSVFAINSLG
ncbi:hypothetical protein [Rothia uropygialis]|uniref:hypothetical protein n=1 Tax=Kocuria sp. 36 TaxID=1415402 RepID=UPI00101B63EA|nr:hypothetical protein [Kocuria sp. 36]